MDVDCQNEELAKHAQATLFNFSITFLPEIVVRTEVLYFCTATGRKVMDWISEQMSCLLGHGHPEIVATIRDHAANLDHLYSGMVSLPVINLADRLTDALPSGLDKAMFLSTGGESNECAIRLAKAATGKFEIAGLSASWHSMTAASNGAQYYASRTGYESLMPGMHMLPASNAYRFIFRPSNGDHDWRSELDYGWSLIDKASCGSLAAVIMEPILLAGGMMTPPAGYIQDMKVHCEKRDMLLIIDEAQTALGRCGSLFAIQQEAVVPDILTLSKTLGNGILLSAFVTSEAIEAGTRSRGFLFYTTHANDPLPASVGLKVLEIVVRDGLVENARVMGAKLHAALKDLQTCYQCIGAVRGRGLMAGLEIVPDRESRKADIARGRKLSDMMLQLGLSTMISARTTFSGCIRIAPLIPITEEELAYGMRLVEEAIRIVETGSDI